MKIKFLTVITSLLTAAFMITSCLDDNEVETEYSSESSITAFAIKDKIETQYTEKVNGKDTTLTFTVDGTKYPFAIDQGTRHIYNVDSLPVGTDISKVVVSITSDGIGVFIVAEDKDSLWNETDSLNFEKPIQFKVMAMSGVYGPIYKAEINVHKQVPDSLQWSHRGSSFDNTIQAQKAVTLGDYIYVFAQQDNGAAVTSTHINDGGTWTPLQALPENMLNADYSSAMAWGNKLYILADNDLYCSSDGKSWSKIGTNTKFEKLIAGVHSEYNRKLYAIDTNNHFMESTDAMAWDTNGEVPANFPKNQISYTAYPLVTNKSIDRMVLMGENPIATDTTSTVWTRLTTEDSWADYPTAAYDSFYCPKLANIAMIHYNDQLYAFGGPGKSFGKDIPAFSQFYESTDQGVTWKPVSRYVFFPTEFPDLYHQADGNYSYVIDKNNFLWIIWSRSGDTNGAQPRGVVGIPGGLGQLSHGVEHNGAAALAGGAHQIGIGPVGGGEDRVVEEAGAEQVGGGGVVGHILAGKLHQLVGDALIGGLLPLEHGTVLPQLCNFLLVPLYHALDHGLGVHSAGQAGNDVAVSDPIDAGRGTTAHKAGDRCHAAHSFQRAT